MSKVVSKVLFKSARPPSTAGLAGKSGVIVGLLVTVGVIEGVSAVVVTAGVGAVVVTAGAVVADVIGADVGTAGVGTGQSIAPWKRATTLPLTVMSLLLARAPFAAPS